MGTRDLLPPSPPSSRVVRVWYVRHGQSVWNSEQSLMRSQGLSEAQIKANGMHLRYTDSPLSMRGVDEAVELRARLSQKTWSGLKPPSSLARALSCGTSRACSGPRLLTSNLRRAIATALLALGPYLQCKEGSCGLLVLPALQETCSYADCSPIPRLPNGSLVAPLLGVDDTSTLKDLVGEMEREEYEQVEQVLRIEADALHGAAISSPSGTESSGPSYLDLPMSHNAMLQQAYRTHLKLAVHQQARAHG